MCGQMLIVKLYIYTSFLNVISQLGFVFRRKLEVGGKNVGHFLAERGYLKKILSKKKR